jgi:hypothetical protein
VHPGTYSSDIREPVPPGLDTGKGYAWRFDVAKGFEDRSTGDEVRLEILVTDDTPDELEVVLLDRTLMKQVDLRQESSYCFHLGIRDPVDTDSDARFFLFVGDDGFIESQLDGIPMLPVATSLHRCFPNPFSKATLIRYNVKRRRDVRLRIYSVSGALVKVLKTGRHEPGRFEVVWEGDNERGVQVSPGVYVCRLETGTGLSDVRKIVVTR